jgi:N-acetylmuramoyl-L-alanine amidase
MVIHHPSFLTRVFRFLFIFTLAATIVVSSSEKAFAVDGAVYVNGKKLDVLYRFKKNGKYFPIVEVSNALGLHSAKRKSGWQITDSWQGEISVPNNGANILERSGVTFVHQAFWTDKAGLEIIDKGNVVYIYNRVVKVEKYDDGLVVTTAAPFQFTTFELPNPSRTVYDFKNLAVGSTKPETCYDFNNCDFTSIRLAQFEIFPHTSRLVIDHKAKPSFTPSQSIIGPNKNAFWIGSGEFIEKMINKPQPSNAINPNSGLITFCQDGSILLSSLNFTDVRSFYLFDTKPYRAVFDLIGCQLPFKDEKAFTGNGMVIQVRLAQFEEKIARVVVELNEPIPMSYTRDKANNLYMHFAIANLNKGFSVLIDPGHGGKDPGAIVNPKKMNGICTDEKTINLKLALELGRILTERGVKVYYTRTDDRFLSLPERRDMAVRLGVDLFVSIHTNSTPKQPQSASSGPEVYYHYQRDALLAREIWNYMNWRTGFKGRGAFFSRFLVTMNPTVPAVIVEAAYLNNPTDLAALVDPSFTYGKQAMLGVAEGITKVFGASQIRKNFQPEITTEEKPQEKIFRPRIRYGTKSKRFSLEEIDIPDQMDQSDAEDRFDMNIFNYDVTSPSDTVDKTEMTKNGESGKTDESGLKNPATDSTDKSEESQILKDKSADTETKVLDKEELEERHNNIFKLYTG